MKKVSFKEAAIQILNEADEPLSSQQIVEIALERGIIETSGATPEATMAAQLYTDINKNKHSKFKKVGKGKFALKKQKESANSPLLAIQAQNELVKQKLIDKIQSMDPFQFEYLTAELLRKIGYENVEVTKRSGDKGVDITANLTVGGLTNVKTVIQVKKYQKGNNISGKYITQLRGSAEVDQRGLIITTSEFTKDAYSESRAINKMPVALVNGSKLIDLLFAYKVGVKEELVRVYSIDTELFENDSTDSETKTSDTKNRSLWPLPGGTYSFVDTLQNFLSFVETSNSSRKDLVNWFINNYDNVTSVKTADGYVNVPKNMGLINFNNGVCYLTKSGKEYIKNKDNETLFRITSENILAFEETYEFLLNSNEDKSDYDVLEFIKDTFQVEWSTLAQVNFRLQWLMNMGRVEKVGSNYIAISNKVLEAVE
ncbi:restriction endonuclease [Pontibacter flavimaris]|uniref:HTH HARE-type domain-containing protein n=1 Tax=Pontibacter flavimaris TaxID=1797110 RepID=A0A1Q5P9P1_9BACT|nr:restriction endonuclease [Pontibacter flavimaris]OKL38956.1 hypothetical protein A3841_03135 [Pontibacter flavimaris]